MTEQELRELDAWIASNIFNLEVFNHKIMGPILMVCSSTGDSVRTPIPAYTTCSAAAMLVLERCLEHDNKYGHKPSLVLTKNEEGFNLINVGFELHKTTSSTFPLTICLFAKKLFGGEA